MFLKNEWYVACRADEITDKPLGRKICNESMVFFRGLENAVSAVEDFCPHRGAPLSLGRVCNGQLVCGYHGLTMGCDGHTVTFVIGPGLQWAISLWLSRPHHGMRWSYGQHARTQCSWI